MRALDVSMLRKFCKLSLTYIYSKILLFRGLNTSCLLVRQTFALVFVSFVKVDINNNGLFRQHMKTFKSPTVVNIRNCRMKKKQATENPFEIAPLPFYSEKVTLMRVNSIVYHMNILFHKTFRVLLFVPSMLNAMRLFRLITLFQHYYSPRISIAYFLCNITLLHTFQAAVLYTLWNDIFMSFFPTARAPRSSHFKLCDS